MLNAIEQQVRLRVSSALSGREHLQEQGSVQVTLREVKPHGGFQREERSITIKPDPSSRRVLPISFAVRVTIRVTDDVRALLLDDVALVAFALTDSGVRTGKDFATKDDRGFDVLSFALSGATIDGGAADVDFSGLAEIWPPTAPDPEFVIERVALAVAAVPGSFVADPPTVAPGGTSRIVVRPIHHYTDSKGTHPAKIEAHVISDLALDERGTIAPEAADASGSEASFDYVAPKNVPAGGTVELIAVHRQTSDGTRGALIGTAAVSVTES